MKPDSIPVHEYSHRVTRVAVAVSRDTKIHILLCMCVATATHHRFCAISFIYCVLLLLFLNSLCVPCVCLFIAFSNAIQLLLRTNSRIIKSFPSKLSLCLAIILSFSSFLFFFCLFSVWTAVAVLQIRCYFRPGRDTS